MKLKLDNSSTRIYTGSAIKVTAVFGFENGARLTTQSVDKSTNLPLWTIEGEFIQKTPEGQEDNVEAGKKIKIASATEPVLKARTEYEVDGDVYATPYLKDGARNAEVSLLVVGSLKPARNGLPEIK